MERLKITDESVAGRRELNEDSVLTTTLSDGRTLMAVADGMGGHAAGEVASSMALESLQSALERGESLEQACVTANAEVHGKATSDLGKHGMGTTLVTVLIEGDAYSIANIGDSRGYEITDEGIRQVTEDHSFVAEAIKRGVDEAEAMQSEYKDALLRAIGTHAEVEVDVFGPFSTERDVALLLCSDGLYKTLTAQDMHDIFTTTEDLDETVQSLVSAAYDAGSDDNITVVLAEWGRVDRVLLGGGLSSGAPDGTLVMDEGFQPPEPEAEPGEAPESRGLAVETVGGFGASAKALTVVATLIVAVALWWFLLR